MANNIKKTRFYATIDGIDRQLFSVYQKSDKSLLFASGTATSWENSDGSLTKFTDQHYSIHRTKDGIDTTITQKTKLQDGTEHSIAAYIHNTRDYLLWPIHARRVPIFNGENRILKSRAKDRVIKLGEYETKSTSLLYSVFVAKAKLDTSFLSTKNVNAISAKFDEFQIIALPAYIDLPSMPSGDLCGLTTSPPTVNGIEKPDHYRLITESIVITDFLHEHLRLLNLLRAKMLDRIRVHNRPTMLEWFFLCQKAANYTNMPIEKPSTP